MKKTREFKNIGTVVANEITLSDTTIGLYIPIETETEYIKAEREKFESWVIRDSKKHCPEVDINKCILCTETNLFVNTGYRDAAGRYEMHFSIGFISSFTDAEGKEIYWDMSDHFDIELSEYDKAYLKKLIALKVIYALH